MRPKTLSIPALISVILFFSFCCREWENTNQSPLKKECEIYEKGIGGIQIKFKELKEAELKNQLQRQLDLRRELDALIVKVNNDLKECSQKQDLGKNIPFIQTNNRVDYEVAEVKLLGCGFNEEIMDFQVQIAAVAWVKESSNNFLQTEFLDSSGKCLKEINFHLTNDYPGKRKKVILMAHIEGIEFIKSFTAIRFK